MLTVGRQEIEVMSFFDWVTLVAYAEKETTIEPVVLRVLSAGDPLAVSPEDLADELDDLLDTSPPGPIEQLIEGILRRLQQQGVSLARRD